MIHFREGCGVRENQEALGDEELNKILKEFFNIRLEKALGINQIIEGNKVAKEEKEAEKRKEEKKKNEEKARMKALKEKMKKEQDERAKRGEKPKKVEETETAM